MHAVVLTGHGGFDRLEYREDWPVPQPAAGEVLVRVAACGMNNTDINTRTGWYNPGVASGTTRDGGARGFDGAPGQQSTWGGHPLRFPRIQGADVVGTIVALGERVDPGRVGERVMIDPWLRDWNDPHNRDRASFLGSERDGGFAQYCTAPARNALAIDSACSDAELATFACSYVTAEHMLTRAGLSEGETILVTGASGGVGSALVQLALRRDAQVLAVAAGDKHARLRDLGAHAVFAREAELTQAVTQATGRGAVDVVADVVGGAGFAALLDLLARSGRYVTAGAIAGPVVQLDLRTLYLKDLDLIGCTVTLPETFARLVRYIEAGEVRPLLARTWPLADIRAAQEAFLDKRHVGNFVLLPR